MPKKFYKLDPYSDPNFGYAEETTGPGPGVVTVEEDEDGFATVAVYASENATTPYTTTVTTSVPVPGRHLAGVLTNSWDQHDPAEGGFAPTSRA